MQRSWAACVSTMSEGKMREHVHEECGVFGVYSPRNGDLATLAYCGLHALQHRGQESAGIVLNCDGVFRACRNVGLVSEVFSRERLQSLGSGNIVVGHVRYATTGADNVRNVQPLLINHYKGSMALAHNGNLTNSYELRSALEQQGSIFHTSTDSEVIAYEIVRERLRHGSIESAVSAAMDTLLGAYSLIISSPSQGLHFERRHCGLVPRRMCVFEYIYFARPDSVVDGKSVCMARQQAGVFLAQEHPVDADVVIGVPDSGLDAAVGFARESGIPYAIGLTKNKYIGRTFIAPTQSERETGVNLKLNPIRSVVNGKRIVLIDDSIVRGTTCRRTIELLRHAGARQIHMRVSAPPFVAPCYYGTDIDSADTLIANHHSVAKIARIIGVDSLGYLSLDHARMLTGTDDGFCTACFGDDYPTDVPKNAVKSRFERPIQASSDV